MSCRYADKLMDGDLEIAFRDSDVIDQVFLVSYFEVMSLAFAGEIEFVFCLGLHVHEVA